ncbi:cytochrome P450 [Cucurbitaria berberidis CBS 394.84]|uniref:Cytochrome P450 n=1 Tax=Cucurbitaria berberidis CBS 394.84 TaxID=1168544 RepID=A0A9P4GJH1_9PLEO|nr:cytochrome P450 [Cucurbitaria berberidis CBS 394.84]KAF1846526.1 cytochrome P450 [Cucurbitaria berberidis CBS 394.84]
MSAEYKKAKGAAFSVAAPDHDHVFISSKQHLKECQKAKKDELSFLAATRQMFQPTYTMLGHNWLDERGAEGIGYVKAVGTLLPERMREIMPNMRFNIKTSFNRLLRDQCNPDGSKVMPAPALIKKVMCDLNGYAFFGSELGQDKAFMETVLEYNELVVIASEVLRITPTFLKGWVGTFFRDRGGIQARVFKMINGVVETRLREKADREAGLIDTPAPSDLVTWTIDTAPTELNWGARRITYEVIALWFGSLHALSATTSYALYDLCLYKEYLSPLREELSSEEFTNFMNTTQGLPLLDSFIKESTRHNPMEAMSGRRQALKDFYYSDGTKVAKGAWTCVPAKAILQDEQYFPDALRFNGFRFVPHKANVPDGVRKALQPEGPSKLTDISPHYHSWGIGSVVCPGRFYASVAMKLVLEHIVQNYEVELVDPKAERASIWRSYVLPVERTKVRFTPRSA